MWRCKSLALSLSGVRAVRICRRTWGGGVYVRVRFEIYLVLRLLAGTMHVGGPQSQGLGIPHLPRVETMVAKTEGCVEEGPVLGPEGMRG